MSLVGLGFAWLGAFLGAVLAFAAAFLYLRFVHVDQPPRNDADWSGAGPYILWFAGIPLASALAGLWLGIGHAYRREASK